MQLTQKIVVITGAGSGIGRALALAIAKECKALALCDIDTTTLEETTKACAPTPVFSRAFDVGNREEMEAFARDTVADLGGVDILINNAGVALGTHNFQELEYADYEWIFQINLWGVIHGTKAFFTALTQSPEAYLINISSVFGLMGVPFQVPYCTTKFAVRGFTESLRGEARLRYPNLSVMSVHPGGIQTNIVRKSRWRNQISEADREKAVADFNRFAPTTAEGAALTILKGIRKNKGRVLIGRDARLVGFITRMWPSGYVKLIANRIQKQFAKVGRVIE